MRILLFVLITLMYIPNFLAQIFDRDPYLHANSSLRSIFSITDIYTGNYIPNKADRFYDMVCHVSNPNYYAKIYGDINDFEHWLVLYEEMYYAAFDTSNERQVKDILDSVFLSPSPYAHLMLMNYEYYELSDTANLHDSTYYNFFPSNNNLKEIYTYHNDHYDVNEIFNCVVTKKSYMFRDVKFIIDPQNIFIDSYNSGNYSNWDFQIDFGDGQGYQSIDLTQKNIVSITYPDSGDYIIQYRLFSAESQEVKRYSAQEISIELPNIFGDLEPSSEFVIPGLLVGQYDPCELIPVERRKAFIYLTGWDPTNTITIEEHYNDLQTSGLADIRNYGYTIFVVKYLSTQLPLEINATFVRHLFDHIKCNIINESDEQYVVMGHSMGGVIGRIALVSHENDPPDPLACNPQRKHNTRLFISHDSPHQGANVPLSLQFIARDGSIFINAFPLMSTLRYSIGNILPNLLQLPAARQMLIYHVNTELVPTGLYGRDPIGSVFYSQLENKGMPIHCKKIAISNGNFNGTNQAHPDYVGYPAYPQQLADNYRFIDIDLEVQVRIFKKDFKVVDASNEVRANPAGSGNLVDVNLAEWLPDLTISWNGTKVTLIPSPAQVYLKYANQMIPICSRSGGYNTGLTEAFKAMYENRENMLYSFGMRPQTSGFPIGLVLNLKNPAHAVLSGYTDAGHFNFIPSISAIDHEGSWNANDISTDFITNWPDLINNTTFDVVEGYTFDDIPTNSRHLSNWPHGGYKNYSFRNDYASNAPYIIPGLGIPSPNLRFLNREIGDNELWLDNYILGWDAHVSAKEGIVAGFKAFQDYYWYSNDVIMPPHWNRGAFSKSLSVNANGHYLDLFTDINGSYFFDKGIFGPYYNHHLITLEYCHYIYRKSETEKKEGGQINSGNSISNEEVQIYPVPANSEVQVSNISNYTQIEIYNSIGEKIAVIANLDRRNSILINMTEYHMKPGIFFVKLGNDSEVVSVKGIFY